MASKKSFKNNPALAYITNPEEEQPEVKEDDLQEEVVESPIKKPMYSSPAKKPPKGYKLNPEYVETKSKRVQLLLQPSIVEAMKKLAKKRKLSFNEACNEAIQRYLNEQEQ